jgi:DNA polymerase-3 subunit alpha
MAYLKANYSKYFLGVLLNSQIGSATGTRKYIMECQKLGIKILPPRINKSADTYRFEQQALRFPYKAIKGIGEVMAKNITAIQTEGAVKDFVDFIRRAQDVNINVIEALIFSGVFNDFGLNKKTMIQNIINIQSYVNFANQGDFKYIEYSEYDYEFLQNKEKELLGVNFEYHPIHKYEDVIKRNNYETLTEVIDSDKNYLEFIAVISKIKIHKTRTGENMAFIVCEDELSSIDGVVFPKVFNRYKMEINNVYLIKGKFDEKKQKQSILIDEIKQVRR